MKKLIARRGIFVFIIALALIISACSNPADGNNGGSNNSDGNSVLSGSISISPNSGDITTGTELTASYSGSEAVSFQWNKGGNPISGETGTTYTPTAAGSYTVTVTAEAYSSKTSPAVTVSNPVNPGNADFTTGPELTLGTGSGGLDYAWTASVPAADSYDLYYAAGNDLAAANVRAGNKTAGASSGGTINGLQSGTVYSVLVAANKSGYNSIYSAVKTVTAPTETTAAALVDMVLIPAGTFQMGAPTSEPGYAGETRHTVTLTSGFYMGKYEVTQAQYQKVMGTNPSYFTTPVSSETSTANQPVETVRWYDTVAFCNKLSMQEGLSPAYSISGITDPAGWESVPSLDVIVIVEGTTGYRLPTEAQWEYACRAGTTTAFNWGTDYIDSGKADYFASWVDTNNKVAGSNLGRPTDVGSYSPNAWGLYDMHGNVWEWCWDRYESYTSGSQTDPMGAVSGDYRMMRGGCWDLFGKFLRSANRGSDYPSSYGYNGYYSFRVVRP